MYCSVCGSQIDENSNFCSQCGSKVVNYADADLNVVDSGSVGDKVFAFVSFGLGITAFVFGFLPIYGYFAMFFSIPALIFSKYGMNSIKSHFARKGRIFAILGLVFGIVISTLVLLLLILG